MTLDRVRADYSALAEQYIDAVGKIEHAPVRDRQFVLAWARGVNGHVMDVGCGPGQWTDYLHQAGVSVEGIDLVEAFIADARDRYPSAQYGVGRAEDLGVPDASLGGVLAWFSLIHGGVEVMNRALGEFARCVRPGGSVLLGFFDGADGEPFDHRVTRAYYWSIGGVTERLMQAGFEVADSYTHADPGARSHSVITAIRQ